MNIRLKMIVTLSLALLLVLSLGVSCDSHGDKVGTLIQDLQSEEPDVRKSAAEALGEIRDPIAIEPLIATTADEDTHVRNAAVEALVQIGTPAIKTLTATLDDEHWLLQIQAAEVLGRIENPEAMEMSRGTLVSSVCAERGAAKMSVYSTRVGAHPIVLLDWSGNIHDWTLDLPTEWVPTSAANIELVACIWEVTDIFDICEYEGFNQINRMRYRLVVYLREAQSGKKIAENTFYGSTPPECQPSEYFSGRGRLREVYGSRISFEEVKKWLSTYVIR